MSSVSNAPASAPFVDRRRRPWLRRLWRLAFVILIAGWSLLLLAWLTLQWGILPRVEQWRPQIAARATAALGVPVSIGAIRVRTGGWMPALQIDDVVLHDASQREALRLPRVQAALSARSLLGLELRFEQLLIDGAALDVRRDAQGRVFVGGIELQGGAGKGGSSDAANWFFAQHEFVIRNGALRWTDERAGTAPLDLTQVEVVVRNGLRSHDLRIDATPPASWGERFSIQGRFTQSLLAERGDWRRWDGELHANLPHADASALRAHLAAAGLPLTVDGGSGAMRAWLEWRDGAVRSATADVALRAVAVRFKDKDKAEPLLLDRVQARLQGAHLDGVLRFAADDLSFAAGGIDWPASRLALSLRGADAPSPTLAFAGGEFSADRLDLGLLAQLASRLPLGEAIDKLLVQLAPSGVVRGLTARWDGSLDAPKSYQAKASVSGLTIAALPSSEPHGVGRPGWRNASIDFEASDSGGKARLVLDKGALILPGIFEQPELAFDSFGTRLSWRVGSGTPAAIEVTLTETRFANADMQGDMPSATWRTGPGQGFGRGARLPGQLDLAGQLTRGRAAAIARYLPLGVAEPARRYVERAVVEGRVVQAGFKVKGDLWDFPFAPAPQATAAASRAAAASPSGGEFRITGKVEDVSFAYVPSEPGWSSPWPAFTRVAGELVFDRSSLELRNLQARLWGLELTKVGGGIRDLTQPVLRIEGQARGPLSDLLRYVNATPVGGWIGNALRESSASGPADLKLALELPLAQLDRSTVQGSVVLAGNDVRIANGTPLLGAAKARVAFTHEGVSVSGGSARVLGGEASFEGGSQADGSLRFSGQGVANAEAMRRDGELGALARLAQSASGQTPFRLNLGFVRGRTELTLTSTLAGLGLDLPAPLRKPPEAAWPLRLETRVESRGADTPLRDSVRFELGNAVVAQYQRDLSRDSPQVLRGAIGIGEPLPPMPERGVHAVASLPAIDADAWQALAERVQGSGAATEPLGVDDGFLPRTLAARALSLTSGGRRLTNLVLGVSQDPIDGTWRGSLDADQLGGYVEYRAAHGAANPGRVYARLARMALPPAEASSVENLLAEAPSTVPALDIVIDDFELRGKKLGRVEVIAANRAAGAREWQLTRLALTNPEAQLVGNGRWQPGTANQRMVLDFKLDLADSGAFLDRLGFAGTLRRGKGTLAGQLSWAGSPLALHVPSLDGRLNLALEAGQFLKAGPGAGRLLSVLSLQALPRRLALDFRDVFQEGFAFDNITGDVTIDDGVASTNNLRMRGVQAAVLMEGSADIGREAQNLRVIVVPEINAGTASLAYAAINPAVGLGTFLAQLVLRRPLIAASTREFTVRGSWDDPKVERVERKITDPVPEIEVPAAAPPPASAPKAAS